MKFHVITSTELSSVETDLLLLGVFSSKSGFKKDSTFESLDKTVSHAFTDAAKNEGFDGKPGQRFVATTLKRKPFAYLALAGMGDKAQCSTDCFRTLGGAASKLAQQKRVKRLAIILPEGKQEGALKAVVEGVLLSAYRYDKYITDKKEESYLQEVLIVLEAKAANAQDIIAKAKAIVSGVCFARDLVNEVPMMLTPHELAKRAQKKAEELKLDVNILDEKDLKQERMGLLLGVGRATLDNAPPRLVRIAYKPEKKAKKKIVLVGKGITFDTGGLDIKPSASMLDMKTDMAGAAAVIGTLLAIAQLEPEVSVVGYMSCAENGIGSNAYHPSDVLTSRKGLTVEVNNTDAEGRLVLADAMDYAFEREKPDVLIDLATLTGACMVALGPNTAAIFSNNDKLASQIAEAGKTSGEDYWRMPLNDALADQLKSPIADIRNSGERWGGAITAALFLKRFVPEDATWAHLDIAGPASTEKDHVYNSKGGTGFAVRTLVEYITTY